MNQNAREVSVGALTLAAVILVSGYVVGGRTVTAGEESTDYILTATFNRVDGLRKGAEVRLGGIRVGTVEDYVLGKDYGAVMTIRISNSVKLPRDSAIGIHTDGLFGAKFVVLDPGGEEDYIKPGEEIEYTQDAMIVGDLLDLIISQGRQARDERRKKDAAMALKAKAAKGQAGGQK